MIIKINGAVNSFLRVMESGIRSPNCHYRCGHFNLLIINYHHITRHLNLVK